MKRMSFLVDRGENDCFMVHGLDWAAYAESSDWSEVTQAILGDVRRAFAEEERPEFLDFHFSDGSVVSLCA